MALFNRRDSAHQSALAAMERLRRKRAYLVTTTWTAYEALSILKRRMGPEESKLLWARLSDRRLVDLFAVDEAVEREAVDLFFAYDDKAWGVVDCASLVVMERTACTQALAFDEHFVEAGRQRGFTVIGSCRADRQ